METQKPTAGKFSMNYGLILGAIMVLISVILYATGMGLEGEQWPVWLYYIIFPVTIIYAISQFKKQNAGLLSLSEALKVGLSIAVISALLFLVYSLIFNYVIDPEYMEQSLKVAEDRLIEDQSLTPEMKEQQLAIIKKFSNPLLGSAIWLALSTVFGLIYSLIGGLVMKKDSANA